MSEHKFSPWPWLIKPAETVKRVINGQEYDVTTRIAILDSTGRAYRPRHTVGQITMGNPCHLANAYLISAAPEMYDLLTRIIRNRQGLGCMVGTDEIIAVLDKANGKESTP